MWVSFHVCGSLFTCVGLHSRRHPMTRTYLKGETRSLFFVCGSLFMCLCGSLFMCVGLISCVCVSFHVCGSLFMCVGLFSHRCRCVGLFSCAWVLFHVCGSLFDNWSLSHLGYLYPGTTPVMIKLDHNMSCPWV